MKTDRIKWLAFICGPLSLAFVCHTTAQPTRNGASVASDKRVHRAPSDSNSVHAQNLLLTPQYKKQVHNRDLLLRPQDRRNTRINPLILSPVHNDTPSQEP